MLELTAVAVITALAVISPGADFAMVTRNSLVHGRFAGLMASAGIAMGVQLHVLYTMLGVGIVLKESAWLFFAVKFAGVFYLVYLGYSTFMARPICTSFASQAQPLNMWGFFRMGFLTNALNPKTTLFVVSVYTQVVSLHTPLVIQLGYGGFMSLAHWLWFSLVALFLSNEVLREKVLCHQTLVNRTIGVVLALLGLSLALSSP